MTDERMGGRRACVQKKADRDGVLEQVSWFAGALTRSNGTLRRGVVALAHDRTATAACDGPLAVAGDGARGMSGGSVCALAGRMHGVAELARELGMPPSAPVHAVLPAGFERLDTGVLERLRGPFAVVLWDARRRRGLVASDLTAQAGLYFTQTAEGLAFATEIRELLEILPARPSPNPRSVALTLANSALRLGDTFYEGVERLRLGSCIVLEGESARHVEHWRPTYEGTLRIPRQELEERLRERLCVAVDRAVGGADVSGVLLSGGLDSSMVAAVAASRGRSVRAYSAVFPDHPELDESEYLYSVADKWQIPVSAEHVAPRGGFAAALEYLEEWKLPVLGIGYVLERALMERMRREGVDAVLDGQGGDEVFHVSMALPAHFVRRGRLLKSLSMLRRTPSTSDVDSPRELARMWKHGALKGAAPLPLIDYRRRGAWKPTPKWLTTAARERVAEESDDMAWRRGMSGPLWWRWLANLVLGEPSRVGRSDYLRHRTAMSRLAGGSPLLDLDLARFVLQVPPELAFDGAYDRPLARSALQGVLPDKVRTRRHKSNLFAFYRDVLAGPDLRWMRRLLNDPDCAVYEFVDRSYMEPLLEDIPAADDEVALILGTLHTAGLIECWLRQQSDPESVTELLEEQDAIDRAGV
jgi:asparagine synthase (glutamine-hydrolysing)